ncbi:MAG: transposase [Deltaproteobacteria bacterium]|nr:transposase [Deltaproteobacteria bacterium]
MTELSVWLLRLGIKVEIIAPGKPQQNGRLERLHRTLKAEVAASPEANRRAQQRAFDLWRRAYNHERPHEALGQRRPASVYTPSPRTYPRPLVALTAPLGRFHEQRLDRGLVVARRYPRPLAGYDDADASPVRVDRTGHIRWERRRIFVSLALAHETVHVDLPDDDRGRRWPVRWRSILLGWLDAGRLDRGLILPVRARR